jgi:uncharacterized protein (TIGR02391 family)
MSLPEKVQDSIEMKEPQERILYYWQPFLDRGRGYLVVTQERLIFHRPGGVVKKPETVFDTYLEDLTNIEVVEIRSGFEKLQINDARNQYQFEIDNPDAISSLLRHLQWARIGYKSGYVERHGFEDELVNACLDDMLKGKHENAVRQACGLLERRIRDEIAVIATPEDIGQALIKKAFHPQDGPLSFGKTDAEKDGLYALYRGAFLMFRNPVSHRYGYLDYSLNEAFEIISFVDLLLKILKKGVQRRREGHI